MRILEARLSELTYCADFGRVEARVTLLVKDREGHPPHEIHLRTNQPVKGLRPVEERLIADGMALAQALERHEISSMPCENLRHAA